MWQGFYHRYCFTARVSTIVAQFCILSYTVKDMLEKIFGSRTRVKLFRLFLVHPEQQHYVREVSRVVDEQINSVRRELAKLEEVGILKSETRDKKKYYQANTDFELFSELRSLMVKSRLTHERTFINAIQKLGKIQYMALTGYFVSDESAPVDLLIVGNVNKQKLDALLSEFQEQFGRQIRYTVMKGDEYAYRKDVTDKFLFGILNGEKIVVVDTLS